MEYIFNTHPKMKRKKVTINNSDRESFVDNEEGFYRQWMRERGRKSKRQFITEHREAIDAAMMKAFTPRGETSGF